MKAWKFSGHLLIGTGILHNTIGLFIGWDVLKAIFESGVVNSINNEMDRNAVFWFLFSGFMMMLFGQLITDYIKENTKPISKSLGVYLLLLTVIGCIMMPVSGFWLVLPQALIIIFASRPKISLS